MNGACLYHVLQSAQQLHRRTVQHTHSGQQAVTTRITWIVFRVIKMCSITLDVILPEPETEVCVRTD